MIYPPVFTSIIYHEAGLKALKCLVILWIISTIRVTAEKKLIRKKARPGYSPAPCQ
ncbi:hypothetical protein HOLDEFILI_00638 [Holdemania filiformis DSM 12042]|uniref:Uncharacterized protein n=1 Tax=Holdemania filiformis DSM 12042 TaxID=545696 RepID=B9Y4A6_9FIRM|nr:hypothetical protein HOLDEFILI_00638 [Holdemania filiformis DSM 12042]